MERKNLCLLKQPKSLNHSSQEEAKEGKEVQQCVVIETGDSDNVVSIFLRW